MTRQDRDRHTRQTDALARIARALREQEPALRSVKRVNIYVTSPEDESGHPLPTEVRSGRLVLPVWAGGTYVD
jgi:hypothetical protein